MLSVGRCCLQFFGLVLFLTVEIWFGFLFAYSGKSVWSFLLTVSSRKLGLVFSAYGSPCPEIGFGFFCLRFATVNKKDPPPHRPLSHLSLSATAGACRGRMGPPKPCRAPGGGAATL